MQRGRRGEELDDGLANGWEGVQTESVRVNKALMAKSGQNQGEWDQLSVLHNYSCPVARVMVCIGAAAVVWRKPREQRT